MAKTIATHNGTFHFDEVTAFTLLRYLYPNALLVRTRDPEIINKADIAIDVGGVYDPDLGRYDHHQSTFTDTFSSPSTNSDKYPIKLSSAGLVYKHLGREIIRKFANEHQLEYDLEEAYEDFYYRFFAEIDAHDNGIRQYSDNFYEQSQKGKIKTHFSQRLTLGYLISIMNSSDSGNHGFQMTRFLEACDFVWLAFEASLRSYLTIQMEMLKDTKLINDSCQKRFQFDPSGQILVVDKDCNNWKKCLSDYEKAHPTEPRILFIVYPNSNSNWGIRTISDQLFKNRRDLLSSDQLKTQLTRPEELIFVHTKLFIGSALNMETAIEMGQLSLRTPEPTSAPELIPVPPTEPISDQAQSPQSVLPQ